MKKIATMMLMLVACVTFATAQDTRRQPQNTSKIAQIKFDKLTHNFGTFSESNAVQTCTFTFSNTGNAPLIINQAVASCGCTVPSYTKKPIQPGDKGEIKITYDGKGKFPGHFKKTITIRTNAEQEMTRLYIEGVMEEAK